MSEEEKRKSIEKYFIEYEGKRYLLTPALRLRSLGKGNLVLEQGIAPVNADGDVENEIFWIPVPVLPESPKPSKILRAM